jgi:DNA-binding transcriptional ArsR family regulator
MVTLDRIRLTGLLHEAPLRRGFAFSGLDLTYANIGIYSPRVARAATTADAFNAIAEPRRRQILDVLAGGELSVTELVKKLGLAQPQVSKHLRVLREVGAVDVRTDGRLHLYSVNGRVLKPIHDWVKEYEQTWAERFDELDAVLDELKTKEEEDAGE